MDLIEEKLLKNTKSQKLEEIKTTINVIRKNNEDFKRQIKFLAIRDFKSSFDNNYIWINSIPESIDNDKHIIFISPNSGRFEDFNSEISELYLHTENKRIWSLDELPYDLKNLAEKCSITMPVSIWSIK